MAAFTGVGIASSSPPLRPIAVPVTGLVAVSVYLSVKCLAPTTARPRATRATATSLLLKHLLGCGAQQSQKRHRAGDPDQMLRTPTKRATSVRRGVAAAVGGLGGASQARSSRSAGKRVAEPEWGRTQLRAKSAEGIDAVASTHASI